MKGRTAANSPPTFAVVSELLGGDDVRIGRVLRVFSRAAADDLRRLEAAVRSGDGPLVRKIAHRMAMACYLVGEAATGRELEAIATEPGTAAISPMVIQHVAKVRIALIESITRTSLHVAARGVRF